MIAAAPDLLAACEAALALLERTDVLAMRNGNPLSEAAQLRAAIAKARGAPVVTVELTGRGDPHVPTTLAEVAAAEKKGGE